MREQVRIFQDSIICGHQGEIMHNCRSNQYPVGRVAVEFPGKFVGSQGYFMRNRDGLCTKRLQCFRNPGAQLPYISNNITWSTDQVK